MKKIVTGIAAIAMAASVFAVDFAAKVYMTGSVIGGGEDAATTLLTLNKTDQKDADALVLSVNGDKAGAQFQTWYNYDGSDGGQKLGIRSTNLWFKPISQLKITVGDVSYGTYKEMIHWWKDPLGGSLAEWNSWAARYSSYATVEAAGFMCDISPINGLDFNLGFAPGAGKSAFSFPQSGDPAVGAWGISAKANIGAFASGVPVTAAVSWRDGGTNNAKVLAIGADYGSAWSNGIYGFLNARLRFAKAGDWALEGITFDNYFKFTQDALQIQATIPVTIRTDASGSGNDPSYLEWEVKVTYGIDAYTPYLFLGTKVDGGTPYQLDDKFGDSFNLQIKPGVTFSVGSCALDFGVLFTIPNKAGKFAWSVPFTAGVAF